MVHTDYIGRKAHCRRVAFEQLVEAVHVPHKHSPVVIAGDENVVWIRIHGAFDVASVAVRGRCAKWLLEPIDAGRGCSNTNAPGELAQDKAFLLVIAEQPDFVVPRRGDDVLCLVDVCERCDLAVVLRDKVLHVCAIGEVEAPDPALFRS